MAWADGIQRRSRVIGFGFGVVKKYGDDQGGRQAALITYYGFLSLFPLLLLAVTILSRILVHDPHLRQRMIDAVVPEALHSTVDHSLTTLPSGGIALAVGLVGLLFAGTGVVFSAYQTVNDIATVPYRSRFGFVPRYLRVFGMLALLFVGTVSVGALTVGATALPNVAGVSKIAAVAGSAVVIFVVLLVGAKLFLGRRAGFADTWPAAFPGAVAIALVLAIGGPLLARFVKRSGPIYGSFATVAGMFALLYLVSQALVYSAEIAAVRRARLWPRALDSNHPTPADERAQLLLARRDEQLPSARVQIDWTRPAADLGGSSQD
jgi:membrane protein